MLWLTFICRSSLSCPAHVLLGVPQPAHATDAFTEHSQTLRCVNHSTDELFIYTCTMTIKPMAWQTYWLQLKSFGPDQLTMKQFDTTIIYEDTYKVGEDLWGCSIKNTRNTKTKIIHPGKSLAPKTLQKWKYQSIFGNLSFNIDISVLLFVSNFFCTEKDIMM